MDIIKPNNDNRIYKYYTLKNNIKCILINDIMLDKSHVVTLVNVGSNDAKGYYDGIAHLLEHMLFITSNKYKQKNYLSSKISEYGGMINAHTTDSNTVYYFDIFNKYLEIILEIFVDFLSNAELKKDYIMSELNNVDSEHTKNFNNDDWKLANIVKLIANNDSKINHFSTGSKKTLDKPDIHLIIRDFYEKYYHANNFSVCIASNKSIDELYKIADIFFGSIKKSNIIQNKNNIIKPIYSNNNGKTFFVKLLSDTKKIIYIFETDYYNINNKIYYLLADLLNSSEKNLFYDNMKLLGYITNIFAYYTINGIFNIEIILTDEGLSNIKYIHNTLQTNIKQIFKLDWNQIFNYHKNKNQFKFYNLPKIDITIICEKILINLLFNSPEYIYYSDYDYCSITNNDITHMIKYINFDNAIKIIAHKMNPSKYIIDLNYNTKFSEIKCIIDSNYNTSFFEIEYFTKNTSIINTIVNIKYDMINEYSKIKPMLIVIKNELYPIKVKNNIWYGETSIFNEPIVYCNILFSNQDYYSTSKNYILTMISVDIINYYLDRELFKAFEYDFVTYVNMIIPKNIIQICFIMPNDRQYIQLHIDKTLDLINDIDIDNKIFNELIKSNIMSIIDSFKKYINPWNLSNYLFDKSYDNIYDNDTLLYIIKTIHINEVKQYIKNIFKKSGAYIIFFLIFNFANLCNG